MSDAKDKGRYLRVYFDRLERDHPAIWFDPTCLATFVRLLALSEKAWPAMPELPVSARRADLEKLKGDGMIELLPNHRFVLNGWVEERQGRADAGRKAVNSRTDRATSVPTDEPTIVPTNVRSSVLPARAPASFSFSSSTDEKGNARDGLPNIDSEAITFLEGITGRHIRQAGDKQLAEYDRQIGDHGLVKVIAAYQRVAKAIKHPTATQLVWSGRKILEPFVDPRELAAEDRSVEDAKRSERRDRGIWQRRIEAYQAGGKWDPAWGDPPVAA